MTSPLATLRIAPAYARQPAPDLAANIRAAQAAGNRAYARAESSPVQLRTPAEEYHFAFARSMWVNGTPMPCACDYCAWLNSEQDEPA